MIKATLIMVDRLISSFFRSGAHAMLRDVLDTPENVNLARPVSCNAAEWGQEYSKCVFLKRKKISILAILSDPGIKKYVSDDVRAFWMKHESWTTLSLIIKLYKPFNIIKLFHLCMYYIYIFHALH